MQPGKVKLLQSGYRKKGSIALLIAVLDVVMYERSLVKAFHRLAYDIDATA